MYAGSINRCNRRVAGASEFAARTGVVGARHMLAVYVYCMGFRTACVLLRAKRRVVDSLHCSRLTVHTNILPLPLPRVCNVCRFDQHVCCWCHRVCGRHLQQAGGVVGARHGPFGCIIASERDKGLAPPLMIIMMKFSALWVAHSLHGSLFQKKL